MSHPQLTTCDDSSALHHTAAGEIVRIAADSVALRGKCRLVLAGGRTPRGVYRLLGSKGFRSQIEWDRLELFWGDERCVPPDHPASNYGMVRDELISRVTIPPGSVHRIRGELAQDRAVSLYEQEVVRARRGDSVLFDLVLLGLGADGHTASLFPDTPDLLQPDTLVLATRSAAAPVNRISLSLRALNDACSVRFLVAGEEKAATLARVLRGAEPRADRLLPAALIKPRGGDLLWLVDRAAASALGPIT
jgi:6-phosphogluconolactonase